IRDRNVTGVQTCALPISGTNRKFDLWVSGYRTDKRTWGIYRTLAEYRGSNQAETLPITRVGVGSPEGKVAAPVGSIYTDTAATRSEERRVGRGRERRWRQ